VGGLVGAGAVLVVLGLLQSRTYGFGVSRADFTIGNTVVIRRLDRHRMWRSVAIARCSCCGSSCTSTQGGAEGQGGAAAAAAVRNKVSNWGRDPDHPVADRRGRSCVISVYLQEVGSTTPSRRLILTPGTIGILSPPAGADRFARRHPQRWLIIAGS